MKVMIKRDIKFWKYFGVSLKYFVMIVVALIFVVPL
jgi:hypothetical protein